MPHRILIVENEPLIAHELEAIVEDEGYEVVGIAATMTRALRMAAGARVDVAIIDIRLAGGDSGLETARRLRADHDVASLFVSANITEKVMALALDWAPIGFIGKPYNADAVLAALRSA
ncbi:response regulator [Aureimonas psammosilenae]|uniref:response regulator n=1 Tax=Aureimonas psammosilenae TaxID=2495496 RepID=UPI001260B44C|nr:response regulator [Aureimonas psammosilenae]